MRSKVDASELVAAAIFCRICCVVALDLQVALGQPRLLLAVGKLVGGVATHLLTQRSQFGVDVTLHAG